MGLHVHDLPGGPSHLPAVLHLSFISQCLIHPSLASVKYTVILFYARVFTVPKFLKVLWVVAGLTTFWLLATTAALVFGCTPVNKAWYGDQVVGKCIAITTYFIGQGIPNTLLDIILVCLPTVFMWRLQMSRGQKMAYLLVFSLGIFEAACSIFRLVVFVRLHNESDQKDRSCKYPSSFRDMFLAILTVIG